MTIRHQEMIPLQSSVSPPTGTQTCFLYLTSVHVCNCSADTPAGRFVQENNSVLARMSNLAYRLMLSIQDSLLGVLAETHKHHGQRAIICYLGHQHLLKWSYRQNTCPYLELLIHPGTFHLFFKQC